MALEAFFEVIAALISPPQISKLRVRPFLGGGGHACRNLFTSVAFGLVIFHSGHDARSRRLAGRIWLPFQPEPEILSVPQRTSRRSGFCVERGHASRARRHEGGKQPC